MGQQAARPVLVTLIFPVTWLLAISVKSGLLPYTQHFSVTILSEHSLQLSLHFHWVDFYLNCEYSAFLTGFCILCTLYVVLVKVYWEGS